MKKRKIIIAILAFIILEAISSFYIEYLHKEKITNYLNEKTRETEIKLNAVKDSYEIMIESLFNQIINKPQVLKLYSSALDADSIRKNEIRDKLYNLLLPTYKQLKVSNIRQVIFIFPDNKVFLRFHRPEKFGDDLTKVRYSVKMANQNKQIYRGFEEGRTYNGFRNIFPIYYKGKHIGVLEISFSFAIKNIFSKDNEALSLMIKQNIANFKLNASQRKNYVSSLLSDDYLHEKRFLPYNKDTAKILKQIDKNIKPIIADRLANNENFTIHYRINNSDYLITFNSIKNVQGNPAAYMIFYHKDKNIIAELTKETGIIYLTSSLVLAILIFVILQISFEKQKLRKKEIQEKKILETFNEGIYIVSPEYNITYANSILQKRKGKNTIIGQKCYKIIHNRDKKCNSCIYDKLKQGEKKINYEFETEDNKTIISTNILLDDNSKLTILNDITEKIKHEQALKESEEKLKLLMDNLPGCAFIKDNKGKYVFLNKYFEIIYGFDISQLTGKGDEEIWGKEKALQFIDFDYKVRNNKGAILVEDQINVKGKKYNWLTSKFNLPNGYIAGVSFDITKQKKAEEALKENEIKLRELNATKDKFFSIIAHDLKSPFNSMLGFAEILEQDFDEYDTAQKKKFINIIHKGLKDTFNLLENLLYWSRSQRGTIDFNAEKINLYLLIQKVSKLLKLSADKKSIKIIDEIPEHIIVKADKDMLSTIIRNVISNAIKFTPKGGQIIIKAQKSDKKNFVTISVQDSGIGIPDEIRSTLFRIDNNTSTKGTENETGTGLGLIICKEFVKKHNGEIWVESEVGKGSIFHFTIPST